MMKPKWRILICFFLGIVVPLLLTGCPGSTQNHEATFSFQLAPSPTPSSGSNLPTVYDGNSWRSAIVVDPSGVTAPTPDPITTPSPFAVTNKDTNEPTQAATGLVNGLQLPLSSTFDLSERPYIVMQNIDNVSNTSICTGAPLITGTCSIDTTNRVQSVVVAPSDYTTDGWVNTANFDTFTTLGAGLATTATLNGIQGTLQTSLFADTLGNTHAFLLRAIDAVPTMRLFSTYKPPSTSSGIDNWIASNNPSELSSSTYPVFYKRLLDGQCTPRIQSDASGNLVAVWCSSASTSTYMYNLFSPAHGWTNPSAVLTSGFTFLGDTYYASAGAALASTTEGSTMGLDVGIDSSGSGWLIAVLKDRLATDMKSVIVARKFNVGVGIIGSPIVLDSLSGADVRDGIGIPRIWIRSDGTGSLFYYKTTGGCPGVACYNGLYKIEVSSTGLWSAPTRVDSVAISTLISTKIVYTDAHGNFQAHEPSLAHWGDYGVQSFVKPLTITGNPRLQSYFYYPTTGWISQGAVDDATLSAGVGWYSISAGAAGGGVPVFGFVFEGLTGGVPSSVYGMTYNGRYGGMTAQTSLSGSLTVTYARPTIATSFLGKTFATFFATVGGFRRAYLSSYR